MRLTPWFAVLKTHFAPARFRKPRQQVRRLRAYQPPCLFEQLEDRILLTNDLFVITHGYQVDGLFPNWVYSMAVAINAKLPDSCSATDSDSDSIPDAIEHSRVTLNNNLPTADSCEHFLFLDWAGESNNPNPAPDGRGWTEIAGTRLFESLQSIVNSATEPVNIHFIGHSRGTVVNSEAIKLLDQAGLDAKLGFVQMTTLDPHPVHKYDIDIIREGTLPDFTNFQYSDPELNVLKVTHIVDFADNYYQVSHELVTIPLTSLSGHLPDGEAIDGAVNIKLTDKFVSWSGRTPFPDGGNHAEVHDWYHWTIDLTSYPFAPTYSDVARVSQLDRNGLYNAIVAIGPNGSSTFTGAGNLGFNWSLLKTIPAGGSSADDVADTFQGANTSLEGSSGSWAFDGKIETNGDSDVFKFMARRSGNLTITQTAAAGSSLDSRLVLYDEAQNEIISVDATGSRGSETINKSVVQGQTYYVRAGAYRSLYVANRTGAYRLEFSLPVTQTQGSDITVLQSGSGLNSGSATPIDFGIIGQSGSGSTRSFTVLNAGNATLTGLSIGELPAGFTLLDGLPTSLAPGGSDTFSVRLDSAVLGSKSGNITITSNDPDEDPFLIAIRGNVVANAVATPEITVFQGATNLINGVSPAIDFGTVEEGQSEPYRLFTVRNEGTAPLTLANIGLPSGFTLSGLSSQNLNPGTSATFIVQLNNDSSGFKFGVIRIPNNDPDEAPFTIAIRGKVELRTTPRPVIGTLIANSNPVRQTQNFTLKATGVAGNVASVEFYRDINMNGTGELDELLSTDNSSAHDWIGDADATGWSGGIVKCCG